MTTIKTVLVPGVAWPYGDTPIIIRPRKPITAKAKRDSNRAKATGVILATLAHRPGATTKELAAASGVSGQHIWYCTTLLAIAGKIKIVRVQENKLPPHSTFYLAQ